MGECKKSITTGPPCLSATVTKAGRRYSVAFARTAKAAHRPSLLPQLRGVGRATSGSVARAERRPAGAVPCERPTGASGAWERSDRACSAATSGSRAPAKRAQRAEPYERRARSARSEGAVGVGIATSPQPERPALPVIYPAPRPALTEHRTKPALQPSTNPTPANTMQQNKTSQGRPVSCQDRGVYRSVLTLC